jgi:hypothetical protein
MQQHKIDKKSESNRQTKNEKNSIRNQIYCKLHGKCNHTTAQCEAIQKHHDDYKHNKIKIKKKILNARSTTPVQTPNEEENNSCLTLPTMIHWMWNQR